MDRLSSPKLNRNKANQQIIPPEKEEENYENISEKLKIHTWSFFYNTQHYKALKVKTSSCYYKFFKWKNTIHIEKY